MSNKAPSLFDDFFFEDKKKEELTVPNKKQEEEKKELPEPTDATGEQKANPEKKESNTIIKKPALELPNSKVLDQQLTEEVIRTTDYAPLIHKDYPFNPVEIEVIKDKKSQQKVKKDPTEQEEQLKTVAAVTENENTFDEDENEDVAPLPEWDLDKNYYSIGEVAKLFDVNISHIRFWTNQFKLKTRTTRKGDRLYTPEQIGELRLIHYLVKVKKHTIKGAKEKLKNQKVTVGNNLQLKDSLIQLRDLLLEIKNAV